MHEAGRTSRYSALLEQFRGHLGVGQVTLGYPKPYLRMDTITYRLDITLSRYREPQEEGRRGLFLTICGRRDRPKLAPKMAWRNHAELLVVLFSKKRLHSGHGVENSRAVPPGRGFERATLLVIFENDLTVPLGSLQVVPESTQIKNQHKSNVVMADI